MISLNTVRRALLGTALLIGCVALAYAMVYLVGAIRGRSGRGDFPILFLIGATLISGTVFLCRLRLAWRIRDLVFSLVLFECLVWICVAWISEDGSVGYLFRLHWIAALFEKFVLVCWLDLNLFIAVPWVCGLLIASTMLTLRGRTKS